jgi:hypothetical protein
MPDTDAICIAADRDDIHLRSGVGYGADLWAAYIAERIAAANFLP